MFSHKNVLSSDGGNKVLQYKLSADSAAMAFVAYIRFKWNGNLKLNSLERSSVLMNSLFIHILQLSLIGIIWTYAFKCEFTVYVPNEVEILITRFIASMMMHLQVEKDIRNGLGMMKYAVNHHARFTNVYVSFCIAALHTFSSFMIEFTVILILLSLENVVEIVMKYVSLAAISNIPRFYYNSLYDNKLLSIAGSHSLGIKHFRHQGHLAKAPCGVKVMRFV